MNKVPFEIMIFLHIDKEATERIQKLLSEGWEYSRVHLKKRLPPKKTTMPINLQKWELEAGSTILADCISAFASSFQLLNVYSLSSSYLRFIRVLLSL